MVVWELYFVCIHFKCLHSHDNLGLCTIISKHTSYFIRIRMEYMGVDGN